LGGTIFPIAARNLIRLVGFVQFLVVLFFSGAYLLQISLDNAYYWLHFNVHAWYFQHCDCATVTSQERAWWTVQLPSFQVTFIHDLLFG